MRPRHRTTTILLLAALTAAVPNAAAALTDGTTEPQPPAGQTAGVAVGTPVDIGAGPIAFDVPHARGVDEVIARLGFDGIVYPADAELLGASYRHFSDRTVRTLKFAASVKGDAMEILTTMQTAYPDDDGWYSDIVTDPDGILVLRVSDFSGTGIDNVDPTPGRPTGVQIRAVERSTAGEFNIFVEEFDVLAELPDWFRSEVPEAFAVTDALAAEIDRVDYIWEVSPDETEMHEDVIVRFSTGESRDATAAAVRAVVGPVGNERQSPDGDGFAFDADGLAFYFLADGTVDAVRFG